MRPKIRCDGWQRKYFVKWTGPRFHPLPCHCHALMGEMFGLLSREKNAGNIWSRDAGPNQWPGPEEGGNIWSRDSGPNHPPWCSNKPIPQRLGLNKNSLPCLIGKSPIFSPQLWRASVLPRTIKPEIFSPPTLKTVRFTSLAGFGRWFWYSNSGFATVTSFFLFLFIYFGWILKKS
jgi:hypothetical protein